MTESASRVQQPRPARPHFTGRAAILAVVLCAIALSLAYPVREYIAERRQLDQLQAQAQQLAAQWRRLEAERQRLTSPSYIEQQARDRLHLCPPSLRCYVIIGPAVAGPRPVDAQRSALPWYARLWSSVQEADKQQPDRAQRR